MELGWSRRVIRHRPIYDLKMSILLHRSYYCGLGEELSGRSCKVVQCLAGLILFLLFFRGEDTAALGSSTVHRFVLLTPCMNTGTPDIATTEILFLQINE